MKCVGCGAELEPGALLCPSCGRVVSSEDVAKSKARSGQLTKKEFYKLPGMKSCRGNIRGCAIILYFCSGMTILASVLMQVLTSSSVMDGFQISASIIDGVLLLALGLWLQNLTTFEPDESQLEVAIAAMKPCIPDDGTDNY